MLTEGSLANDAVEDNFVWINHQQRLVRREVPSRHRPLKALLEIHVHLAERQRQRLRSSNNPTKARQLRKTV